MVNFQKIPSASTMATYDWRDARSQLRLIVGNLEGNLTLFEREMKRIQNLAKDKLKQLAAVLQTLEKDRRGVGDVEKVMGAAQKLKVDISQLGDAATALNKDYFDAHSDFRVANSFAKDGIPPKVAEALGKARTAQQNKAKVISVAVGKVRDDYVNRASAIGKQLKAQAAGAQTTAELTKKLDSLVAKLAASAASAEFGASRSNYCQRRVGSATSRL